MSLCPSVTDGKVAECLSVLSFSVTVDHPKKKCIDTIDLGYLKYRLHIDSELNI